jgi:hypothetical protein
MGANSDANFLTLTSPVLPMRALMMAMTVLPYWAMAPYVFCGPARSKARYLGTSITFTAAL